jgi:hypothetical protein
MPIPPPTREGAERVIAAMIQRLQVTRADIMLFLDYGRFLDLSESTEPAPPKDGKDPLQP